MDFIKNNSKDGKNERAKILIKGIPKSGKSTFAEKLCRERKYNACVIDIDDTNRTGQYRLLVNDNIPSRYDYADKVYRNIIKAIDMIVDNKEPKFNCIILDGCTLLQSECAGDEKGFEKHNLKSDRLTRIIRKLRDTDCHLIFIGQPDLEWQLDEDGNTKSNKFVQDITSLVNEVYECKVSMDSEGNNSFKVITHCKR